MVLIVHIIVHHLHEVHTRSACYGPHVKCPHSYSFLQLPWLETWLVILFVVALTLQYASVSFVKAGHKGEKKTITYA